MVLTRTCCTSGGASICAALAAQVQPEPAQFLPVTLMPVDTGTAHQPVHVHLSRPAKPPAPRQPASAAGIIEIKFGGPTVRIDGLVDASVLKAVLSHFHPSSVCLLVPVSGLLPVSPTCAAVSTG